ncbi:MAG: hypothetical protein IMHGJWDQ_001602 [Candidatus Fervidibacter sp.]
MDYEAFSRILSRHLFQETRRDLLEKLVSQPERFVGLFRPTRPKSKIFQHILQASEIKFGEALEEIVGQLLEERGYIPQDKRIGKGLKCDHYFLFPDCNRALLIEQKVRDDHDSTKRQGQWKNFAEKVEVLVARHKGELVAVMYFVDPSLKKNRAFYERQIADLLKGMCTQYPSVCLVIWYGEELFEKLPRLSPSDWKQMLQWLAKWKSELPELPDVNWESKEALQELEQLAKEQPSLWLRFAQQEELWKEGIVGTLFPTGSGLRQIVEALEKLSDDKRA